MQVGLALATVQLLNTPTVLVLRYRNFPTQSQDVHQNHRPAHRGVSNAARGVFRFLQLACWCHCYIIVGFL